MLRKIEELRNRPKEVRNRFAFYGAFVLTGVVAFFWFLSVPAKFAEVPQDDKAAEVEGGFKRAFSDIKAQFATAIKSMEDIEVPEEIVKEDEVEENKINEIDIAAMFAKPDSSSTSKTEVVTTTTKPKTIIIATTSSGLPTTSDQSVLQ